MKNQINNKSVLSFLFLMLIFAVKAKSQNGVSDIHGTWVLSTSKHSNVLPDTIHIQPSKFVITTNSNPQNQKFDPNSQSLIKKSSLMLIYTTLNKWTDTCKIELLDKSKIKGLGIWRAEDGKSEKFKVEYSFLPEICSNHTEGHIAKNPKEREELTEKKHCTGFHSL